MFIILRRCFGTGRASVGDVARKCLTLQAILIALVLCGRTFAQAGGPATQPVIVHLPGIGGYQFVDRDLLRGLIRGGVKARLDVWDWTLHDAGLLDLHNDDHNHAEAEFLAERITEFKSQWPNCRIVLTSHSGGGGIAVWTLERLPAGVQVDSVFLLSPAISPGYDLSRALCHVRGTMYVFYSKNDYLILGIGCGLFGTIDGVTTPAAGMVGFILPKTADAEQYRKLEQVGYDPNWASLGNFGDHIGPTATPFAAKIIAPLIRREIGQAPEAQ